MSSPSPSWRYAGHLGRDKWRHSQLDTGFLGLWFSCSLCSQMSHCLEGKASLTATLDTLPSLTPKEVSFYGKLAHLPLGVGRTPIEGPARKGTASGQWGCGQSGSLSRMEVQSAIHFLCPGSLIVCTLWLLATHSTWIQMGTAN